MTFNSKVKEVIWNLFVVSDHSGKYEHPPSKNESDVHVLSQKTDFMYT